MSKKFTKHLDETVEEVNACPVDDFIRDNTKVSSAEKQAAVERYLSGKPFSRECCREHPQICACGGTIVYTSEQLLLALGKSGGTPLPKKCSSCCSARKDRRNKLPKGTDEDMHKLSRELFKKVGIYDDQGGVKDGTSKSAKHASSGSSSNSESDDEDFNNKNKVSSETTTPRAAQKGPVSSTSLNKKKVKTPEQIAKEVEWKERQVKGGIVNHPSVKKKLLPIYCSGGLLCGKKITYTVDCAETYCSAIHKCGWKSLKCVHCQHVWGDSKHIEVILDKSKCVKLKDNIRQMFTHHICIECKAGLHSGVCNHYGVLLH